MTSDSASHLATQQSIKAYVDAQVTAEDLDFQADTGGALNIDLDSESLTFTGGTGIDTSGSGNAVTFAIDSTVATLTGSQTLTNKSIDASQRLDIGTVANGTSRRRTTGTCWSDIRAVTRASSLPALVLRQRTISRQHVHRLCWMTLTLLPSVRLWVWLSPDVQAYRMQNSQHLLV